MVYGVALRVRPAGAAVGSLRADVHAKVVDAGAVGRAVGVLKTLEFHASNPKKRTTFNQLSILGDFNDRIMMLLVTLTTEE